MELNTDYGNHDRVFSSCYFYINEENKTTAQLRRYNKKNIIESKEIFYHNCKKWVTLTETKTKILENEREIQIHQNSFILF